MTRPGPVGVRARPVAPARAARGVLVGLVSGAGALLAHQLAGSHAAPLVALVVTVLAVAGGVVAARWRIGLPSAVAVAAGAQAASHLLLAGSAGHAHLHTHGEHLGGPGPGGVRMVAGHVAVALATALLSRGADQVVLRLLRTLVAWVVPRLRTAPLPPPRRPRPHRLDARRLPALLGADATSVSRRGPPTCPRTVRLAV